jgi:hypothetical protein
LAPDRRDSVVGVFRPRRHQFGHLDDDTAHASGDSQAVAANLESHKKPCKKEIFVRKKSAVAHSASFVSSKSDQVMGENDREVRESLLKGKAQYS